MLYSCENEKFDPQSLILCIDLPNHILFKFLIYLNNCQMYSACKCLCFVIVTVVGNALRKTLRTFSCNLNCKGNISPEPENSSERQHFAS